MAAYKTAVSPTVVISCWRRLSSHTQRLIAWAFSFVTRYRSWALLTWRAAADLVRGLLFLGAVSLSSHEPVESIPGLGRRCKPPRPRNSSAGLQLPVCRIAGAGVTDWCELFCVLRITTKTISSWNHEDSNLTLRLQDRGWGHCFFFGTKINRCDTSLSFCFNVWDPDFHRQIPLLK